MSILNNKSCTDRASPFFCQFFNVEACRGRKFSEVTSSSFPFPDYFDLFPSLKQATPNSYNYHACFIPVRLFYYICSCGSQNFSLFAR